MSMSFLLMKKSTMEISMFINLTKIVSVDENGVTTFDEEFYVNVASIFSFYKEVVGYTRVNVNHHTCSNFLVKESPAKIMSLIFNTALKD